jgi:hypothetical protein
MAGLVPPMWTNDGEDSPVGTVVRAMTASPIEQDEPLMTKQGVHLAEMNQPLYCISQKEPMPPGLQCLEMTIIARVGTATSSWYRRAWAIWRE